MSLTKSIVEDTALTWFGELGYDLGHEPQLAPGEPAAERFVWRGGAGGAVARGFAAVESQHSRGSAGGGVAQSAARGDAVAGADEPGVSQSAARWEIVRLIDFSDVWTNAGWR